MHTHTHTFLSQKHTHTQVLGIDPATMDVSEQIAVCSNIHIFGMEPPRTTPSHAHDDTTPVDATSQGTHTMRPNDDDDARIPDSEQRELSGQNTSIHVHIGAASLYSTTAAHTHVEASANTAPTSALSVHVPVLPPPPLARNKASPHGADVTRIEKDLIDLSTPPGGNSPRELLDGAW